LENNIGIYSVNKQRLVQINFEEDLNFKNVLIVDDAIDTGYSIKQVISALSARFSNIGLIKVAVITLTKKSPVYFPDYYIYNNQLCLFPWSLDSLEYEEYLRIYNNINKIK